MRSFTFSITSIPTRSAAREVYVHFLATAQRTQGLDVAMAAPAPSPSRYEHDHLPVWGFPVSKTLMMHTCARNFLILAGSINTVTPERL